MAKYRLIPHGKGNYKIVGLYSPAKGGSQQIFVVNATLNDLAEKTEGVAEKISHLRPKRREAANDWSKLEREVLE